MAELDFRFEVAIPPAEVRRLLMDEAFLEAFVNLQHPLTKSITIDTPSRRSTSRWRSSLDGGVPGWAQMFVGEHVDVELVIDLAKEVLDLTATAKRQGRVPSAEFKVRPVGAGGELSLTGDVYVSGFGGGWAETTVRDQVILPVFAEDLVPLLNGHPG